ncbi:universal stress protein [Bacillus gobiensis]|uniref:universal stress protein n=1 Tax=Bacillus gobiensis TaxID=1441095 RepID=UPI003D1D9EEA
MFSADRILVAFDGSVDSKKALKKAIDLSKKLDSNLSIAHAHEDRRIDPGEPPRPYGAAGYVSGGTANIPIPNVNHEPDEPLIYDDGSEEVMANARMILDENHYEGNIKVLEGEPADAILEYAEEISADLIVMGSRDQNRLSKLLFGSVSEKLSSESEIPVLIVK